MSGHRLPKEFSAVPWLTAGFVLLALVVVLPFMFAARQDATEASAQRALEAQECLSDLFSTMREAENGSRGYLITDNPISLNTYRLAQAGAPADLQKLDRLLAGGPDAARLPLVHDLVAQKFGQLNQTMALLQAGNKAGAAALINTDLNLLTMVQLRSVTADMQADQANIASQARIEDARDGQRLQLATSLAVLGTLLLAWFATRANAAQTRSLREAETALIAANSALELKVAERTATLHASEARFRILSETLPGLVYMTDQNGKTIYVNPQAAAYSGRPLDAALGYGWTETVHEDDLVECLARWYDSVSTGKDYAMEYRLRRYDGVYRWFIDRAVALKNAEGAITAWIGSSTDIHDRKQAEAAMANTNALLEQRVAERSATLNRIFRLSTDILTVSRFDGTFMSVSPAWERITGRPVEDVIGRSYSAFLHPDDAARTASAFATAASGEPMAVENRYACADGSYRWLSWRATAELDRALIYCVARDITAERERDEQLRQSQKMEVVGQLTGGVAHDFNNLLTIIMGSLELLQRGMADADDRMLRRLETAFDAARRAAALTHRLLAFSRRQPLTPMPLDVGRLLAGMSDMLHRTLGETITVEVVERTGLWRALADANQLENAILNLAVNARDAMPAGGHLTIETRNADFTVPDAAMPGDMQPGEYVWIAVTDSGCGMEPEVRDRVFEPFFTTKPPGQGTGLGLAQVYGFIMQSGGHVSVQSAPGAGTTVHLYLPRPSQTAAVVDTAVPGIAARVARPGESVLIVEDDPAVREFSAEVLAEFGYQVFTAHSGPEALGTFAKHPNIRLLFTDIVLGGGMNGQDLAAEVTRRYPAAAVLFTTGYTRGAIAPRDRLGERVHYIAKPFTAAALGEAVGTLFESARLAQE